MAFGRFDLDLSIPINVFNYLIIMENINEEHQETHHIVSYATNLKVWIGLMVLTWATITAAYLNFGTAAVGVALIIASVKSYIVLSYYMHLKFDSKLLTVLLLVTMTIFVGFIVLTFFDFGYR